MSARELATNGFTHAGQFEHLYYICIEQVSALSISIRSSESCLLLKECRDSPIQLTTMADSQNRHIISNIGSIRNNAAQPQNVTSVDTDLTNHPQGFSFVKYGMILYGYNMDDEIVASILCLVKSKKSGRVSQIPAFIYTTIGPSIISPLTYIMNSSTSYSLLSDCGKKIW